MSNRTQAVLQAVNRRKRSVASVVSVGAIGALALGTLGTGVAAAHGMVGSGEITNQSIRSWDIHRDAVGQSELRGAHDDRGPAVRSHQVANESLLHYDIKDGTLGLQDFSQSAKDGLKGDKGAKGDPGVSGAHTEKPNDAIREVTPGQTVTTVATCNEGESAIGGGYHVKDAKPATLANARVTKSGPGPNDSYDGSMFGGYEVTVTNTGENGAFNVYPYVICATVN